MALFSVNKIPKKLNKKAFFSGFVKLKSFKRIGQRIEIFKIIKGVEYRIIGVDFYDTAQSKRILNKELEEGILYIKKTDLPK